MMSNDPLHGGLCTYLLWDIFLLQRFLVCVSIVDFWFAVILKFWYKSLYVYEIVLSCCSLNCKFISGVPHLYPPLLMISEFDDTIACGWFCIFTVYISLLVSLFICGTLFLVTYFSFPPREVPLVFVVKLREFSTTKPALWQILMELFQEEKVTARNKNSTHDKAHQ